MIKSQTLSNDFKLLEYSTQMIIDLEENVSKELMKELGLPTLQLHKDVFLPDQAIKQIVYLIDLLKQMEEDSIISEEFNLKIIRNNSGDQEEELGDDKIGFWYVDDSLNGYIVSKYMNII